MQFQTCEYLFKDKAYLSKNHSPEWHLVG